MPSPLPEVGDKIVTWFSGNPDKLSTVLKVLPYTGKYSEFFSCVVRVTADTPKGWAEMAWGHYDRVEVKHAGD